ncbi:41094_t:CDS:2, partial [Gigaspora margarita]
ISHAIAQYVQIGYNLDSDKKIQTAIQDLSGTFVANIEPLHDHINIKTIKQISKYFYWKWPVSNNLIGFIMVQELPNIKEWKLFSSKEITKLVEKNIHKSNLYISDYSSPKKLWIIPIPQKKEIFLILKKYSSSYPLSLGWVLRNRISATEMVKELEIMVKKGELNAEIPIIKIVEGWIKTYSGKLYQLSTQNLLNSNSNIKDNTLLQELSYKNIYNYESDKENNSISDDCSR